MVLRSRSKVEVEAGVEETLWSLGSLWRVFSSVECFRSSSPHGAGPCASWLIARRSHCRSTRPASLHAALRLRRSRFLLLDVGCRVSELKRTFHAGERSYSALPRQTTHLIHISPNTTSDPDQDMDQESDQQHASSHSIAMSALLLLLW